MFRHVSAREAARAILLGLFAVSAAMTPTTAALAQTRPFDDPESTVVSEVVVVAASYGPAWWKVSKGDSVVWILGLPPTVAPLGLKWDTRTAERRLTNARSLLLPPDGKATLDGRWEAPLPAYTQARIALAAVQVGFEPQYYITPPNLMAVLKLRGDFQKKLRLGYDPQDPLVAIARRKSVPIFQHTGLKVELGPDQLNDSDREVAACLSAMLEEVETEPAVFKAMADHWAKGRAAQAIAGPRGAWPVCMNRMMPGYSRRLIETQTAAISAALEIPGKVVALVPMRQLVAEEGVLARLRAQGYAIADPTKPLSE